MAWRLLREVTMRIKWLLIFLLALFGDARGVSAQVADVAGVLPGDRWVYEHKDEITGDLKMTTTIVVIDVSGKEINTRLSVRGAARPRQVVFVRNWNRVDDGLWKHTPSDGTGIKMPMGIGEDWRFESKAMNLPNGTAMNTTGRSKVVGKA